MNKIFIAAPLLLLPSMAFAYLDPGTGNALIYLILGLMGTLVYGLKGIFYKMKAVVIGTEVNSLMGSDIVLFSEGKNYWYTFRPVVESLIKKKIKFDYLSMDIEDPGLKVQHDLMEARYIGSGASGFVKVAHKSAKVMLSTTPNIGCPDFPMPKPSKVDCLAHVFHAVGDVGFYHKGSLDHYDAVLMSGDFIEKSVRLLEKNAPLKTKSA